MSTPANNETLLHQLALAFVPGVGAKTGRLLLERFGDAVSVFKAPLKELKQVEGISETRAKGFRDATVMQRASEELEFIEKHHLHVLFQGHNYPRRLTQCADVPLLLYYRGTADLDTAKVIAIVGTRKNTDYGQQLCEELVEAVKSLGDVVIVSGLALGIDAIAHKRCVQLGIPTVGVLGHGLDRIYPFSHKTLAEQMLQQGGGLLTEFPSGTLPDRNNFPMRNRLVAGMSDVTVVIESGANGGALITAHLAAGYNREVAAYPGRVNDSRSAGCNELIRANIAAMITKPADLLELMNWNDKKAKPVQKQLFLNLSPQEQRIVDILTAKESLHADELFHHTGLSNSQLAATLLQLEMQGIIRTLPGKFYRMS
jgi:DNA processing protein